MNVENGSSKSLSRGGMGSIDNVLLREEKDRLLLQMGKLSRMRDCVMQEKMNL